MPANVDALVQEGITAFKAGNRDAGKQALMKAVEIDERNEQAWLWLAAAVDTLEERLICLENVLQLNPANVKAQKGVEATKREIAAGGGSPAEAMPGGMLPPSPGAAQSPFAGFDGFGAPAPASSPMSAPSSPFAGTGFDSNPYKTSDASKSDPAMRGWTGFDTSFGAGVGNDIWGAPPSNPIPTPPQSKPSWGGSATPQQLTSQDYDSWMKGLSLPGSGAASSGSIPAFSDPFGNADPFGLGGGNNDFGATASPGFDANAPWGGFDTSANNSGTFGGDFGFSPTPSGTSTAFNDVPYTPTAPEPYINPTAPARSPFDNFNFDAVPTSSDADDPFNFGSLKSGPPSTYEFGSVETAKPPVRQEIVPEPDEQDMEDEQASASPFDMLETFPVPKFEDDPEDLTARVSAFDVPTGDANVLRKPIGSATSDRLVAAQSSGASVFTTIDSHANMANPSIYFQQIPDEIQAIGPVASMSRSIRTPARVPALLILTVLALIVLNIGSLIFLVANLPR
jgi:hypothetical protein